MALIDTAVLFWPFFATIASSMVYVLVCFLYYSSFRALLKADTLSVTSRRLLCIYITVLLALTTWSLAQQIYAVSTSLFYPDPSNAVALNGAWGPESPPLLVITVWAADGFMIWSVFILYQHHRSLRAYALTLISSALIGYGIFIFMFMQTFDQLATIASATLSTFSNLFLSLLLAGRLLYLRKGFVHGLVYTGIISLCVESGALITIFMVIYVIMFATSCRANYIPLFLLPHICVISALLMVRRVAQGVESTTTITPPPEADVVQQPPFAHVAGNSRFMTQAATGDGREGA
ncbi:hypothetical protein GALMADRAFT_141659 [Galerina marginata CBS 339.88]|uniref:Uncharacterized protein n=1 Tax=Galerina marginata (strain CBS 339.88) TaxID=685588 RepID=A0A067T1S6_GALM3|nr:hypothetical protein GALMADRAFT_141659 [Galerina marginata CBS 339.88]